MSNVGNSRCPHLSITIQLQHLTRHFVMEQRQAPSQNAVVPASQSAKYSGLSCGRRLG